MKTLKVAIDARLVGGTNTGDSTYWTGLVDALARQRVQLLLLSNVCRPEVIPESDTVRWINIPAPSNPLGSSRWWSLVAFPLAARKLRADVIHNQYTVSPLAGSHAVTTIHDVSFFIGPEWFRPKDRWLLQMSVPPSAKRAKAIITVSESSRREIEHWVPSSVGKVHVTPLACPHWIQPVDPLAAQQIVRERLGLEEPFLLTVSTRWPRKNMGLAIDAVNLLPKEMHHRLVLTGKAGWDEPDPSGRAIRVGYVENDMLCALYSAALCYLAPSRHEGFGIPILEAFRCGCPVIASTGGALPEVVGEAGIICDSWSPADWAAIIAKTLPDSSKIGKLKQLGWAREKQFTWTETALKTLEVYESITR